MIGRYSHAEGYLFDVISTTRKGRTYFEQGRVVGVGHNRLFTEIDETELSENILNKTVMLDKPEEEVNVRVANCPRCKGVVFTAVEHLISKSAKKELGKLVGDGCSVKTVTLFEYRKSPDTWCDCK